MSNLRTESKEQEKELEQGLAPVNSPFSDTARKLTSFRET